MSVVDEIKNSVKNEIAALHSHHINLSYTSIVTVVLAAILVGSIYIHSVASNERAYQKAEDAYKLMIEHDKSNSDALKQSFEERLADQKAIAQDAKEQADRAIASARNRKEVTDPTKTAAQVAADTQKYLNVTPVVEPDGNLGFNVPAVQSILAMKIDFEQVKGDLKNETDKFNHSQNEVASLTKDKDVLTNANTECRATVEQTRKEKNPSRWRRVGDILLGVLVGKGIGTIIK